MSNTLDLKYTEEIEIEVEDNYENNYSFLKNKPKINGHEVNGDMSLDDLGIKTITEEDKQALDKLKLKDVEKICQYMGQVEIYAQLDGIVNKHYGDIYSVRFNDCQYIWDGQKWLPFFGVNSGLDAANQPDKNVMQTEDIDSLF